jgi:pimeloyl-ACP methyl ester carboxylesterase
VEDVRLASLRGTLVRPSGAETAPPALLLHGIGLGRWIWPRFQQVLAEAGVPSVAVDLPGHDADRGDPGLEDVISRVTEAADALPGCAIVGHSFGGYVAQVVAATVPLHALALVAALPTAGVPYWPTRSGVRVAMSYLPHVARGTAVRVSYEHYLATGLSLCPAERQREWYDQIVPWPGRLVRDLARRPHRVDPRAVRAPVVVVSGKEDLVVRWQVGRRLGEWYDALVWRYDDLGHLPMLQDSGSRMEQDLAGWLVNPRRRNVREVEAWAPNEGRGLASRAEAMSAEDKKRSAYGQRAGRSGSRGVDRWDQNLRSGS